jgi:hypothetical protein
MQLVLNTVTALMGDDVIIKLYLVPQIFLELVTPLELLNKGEREDG